MQSNYVQNYGQSQENAQDVSAYPEYGQTTYDFTQYPYDQTASAYNQNLPQMVYSQNYGVPPHGQTQNVCGEDSRFSEQTSSVVTSGYGNYDYSQNQPTYESSQIAYGQDMTAYNASQTNNNQTQSGYGQHQAGYDEMGTSYGQVPTGNDQAYTGYLPQQVQDTSQVQNYEPSYSGYDQMAIYSTEPNQQHELTSTYDSSQYSQYSYGQTPYDSNISTYTPSAGQYPADIGYTPSADASYNYQQQAQTPTNEVPSAGDDYRPAAPQYIAPLFPSVIR